MAQDGSPRRSSTTRRPDQLDRDGDLLDLILAQQLAHHPAGQHAILAQRAPHLGQVIGGGGGRPSARRRPRRFAWRRAPLRVLAGVAPPQREQRRTRTRRSARPARPARSRATSESRARRGSGGGAAGAGGGAAAAGAGAGAAASAASADSGTASRAASSAAAAASGTRSPSRVMSTGTASPSRRFLIRFLRSLRNGGGSLAVEHQRHLGLLGDELRARAPAPRTRAPRRRAAPSAA